MQSNDYQALKQLIEDVSKITIISHKNPDGDAVGSVLALHNVFNNAKIKSNVILPDSFPENYDWLEGSDKIVFFEDNAKRAKEILSKSDLIFCLDFNATGRVGDMKEALEESEAIKIMIDHHPQPETFAKFTLSDTSYSSTSELLYYFLEQIGYDNYIDNHAANCLYTGIVTDTGSFKFASATARTHETTAKLMQKGANNALAQDKIFNEGKENRLRLLGYCLSEKLKIFEELGTAFFSLRKDELSKFNYTKGDTEGVVNYALSIKGINFAAFFTEKEDIISISFRSRGKFSVNEFSRANFNGGGHLNAAGGKSDETLDETINKFISLLSSYKNEINSSND
jgi:bifunctional oligoribonuclease and PAP phosphatase NrnA